MSTLFLDQSSGLHIAQQFFIASDRESWTEWASHAINWGYLFHGTKSWIRFSDVMKKLSVIDIKFHVDDEEHHNSFLTWMRYFSGKSEDIFDFQILLVSIKVQINQSFEDRKNI